MLDEETALIAYSVTETVRNKAFLYIFIDIDRNMDGLVTSIEFYSYHVGMFKCLIKPEPHSRAMRRFLLGLK